MKQKKETIEPVRLNKHLVMVVGFTIFVGIKLMNEQLTPGLIVVVVICEIFLIVPLLLSGYYFSIDDKTFTIHNQWMPWVAIEIPLKQIKKVFIKNVFFNGAVLSIIDHYDYKQGYSCAQIPEDNFRILKNRLAEVGIAFESVYDHD